MHRPSRLLAILASSLSLAACASVVPRFDVPYDEHGVPTAQTIVHQITCELAQLIEGSAPLGKALLEGDIEVAFQLNLTVNDTGGLSPTFTYTNGVFSFGAGAGLSRSREQNFTEKLYFSLRDLQLEQIEAKKRGLDLTQCWQTDTNLSGDLGLRTAVQLAFSTPHLRWETKLSGTEGAFGGYVDFVVTKNLNSVGPTWTLTHFKGPGVLPRWKAHGRN